MADPRYRNGVHQSAYRRRLGLTSGLDTPLLHGWAQVRENADHYSVFALTLAGHTAEMRMTTPQERVTWPYDWLVSIGPKLYGFDGDLKTITAEVRAMLRLALGECVLCPNPATTVAGDFELCPTCYEATQAPAPGLDEEVF